MREEGRVPWREVVTAESDEGLDNVCERQEGS